jgi:hypothetical protein
VTEESDVLDQAKKLFNQGDYSYLQTLPAKPYRTKPPFGPLLAKGTNEMAVLVSLSSLKQATNWTGVRAVLADPVNKDFVGKASFLTYSQWADGMATAERRDLDQAQQALDQCDFAKVQQISSTRTGTRDFDLLAAQAKNISDKVTQLQALKDPKSWSALNTAWSQLDNTLKQKTCFAEFKTWLDANSPCRQIEAQLMLFEVQLGTKRRSPEVIDPATRKAAEKISGDIDHDYWLRRVNTLRGQLKDCSLDKKDERLKALEKAIDQWS